MAFTTTRKLQVSLGNRKQLIYSFDNNAGSTGGSFKTPFRNIDSIIVQPNVWSGTAVYTGTCPITSGTVTINSSANCTGQVIVIGY